MKRKITVLGTGRMGSALALAFLEHGHTVTVWNRTASKAKPLEAKGIRVATSVEDAVAHSEIVVGNVTDYATSASLLAPPTAAKAMRGKLFVQLATGTPRQAKELAVWAREHGVDYLDGAIMATPNMIGQPGCAILYSGAPELFESNKPVFAALGGNASYVGAEIGHASTLDAALLSVLWGMFFGTLQAAAICEAEGLPLEAFSGALGPTMPALEGILQDTVQRIRDRRFAADEATFSAVETCHASARLIHDISKEHGIHLGLSEALETIFRRAADAGRGPDDMSSVYQGMKG